MDKTTATIACVAIVVVIVVFILRKWNSIKIQIKAGGFKGNLESKREGDAKEIPAGIIVKDAQVDHIKALSESSGGVQAEGIKGESLDLTHRPPDSKKK